VGVGAHDFSSGGLVGVCVLVGWLIGDVLVGRFGPQLLWLGSWVVALGFSGLIGSRRSPSLAIFALVSSYCWSAVRLVFSSPWPSILLSGDLADLCCSVRPFDLEVLTLNFAQFAFVLASRSRLACPGLGWFYVFRSIWSSYAQFGVSYTY